MITSFSYDEYLDFKKYVDKEIIEEYSDTWIRNYIDEYLFNNKLELSDIKTYVDRQKLNKYLLDLHKNNLLRQLEVAIHAYKYEHNNSWHAKRIELIAQKLGRIPTK